MTTPPRASNPAGDMLASQEIVIRPITDLADLSRVEAIQRDVWELPDDLMIVPTHMLKAVASFGGVLLGAYGPKGDVVGFVFGFLAYHHGAYCHHSHMMGVLHDYRDMGIGELLKLAQRDTVLAQGMDTISWTYDPLESRNAHLNVNKLGAVCRTYIRDLYGAMVDGLNADLPSDRFLVEWQLRSPRVVERIAHSVAPPSFDSLLAGGALVLDEIGVTSSSQPAYPLPEYASHTTALVQIPADYQQVRDDDPAVALEWRLRTRRAFETLFASGFLVTGLVRSVGDGIPHSYYLLERTGPEC